MAWRADGLLWFVRSFEFPAMLPRIWLVLLSICAATVTMDAVGQSFVHLAFVHGEIYLGLLLFGLAFIPGGLFYTYYRIDRRLAALFFGLSFMAVFGPACSLLTYFGTVVAGPNIDATLAGIDRALGFNWPATVAFVAGVQPLNWLLGLAYRLSIWQVMLLILCLGWRGGEEAVGRLCLAIAVCGLSTCLFWTMFPSFGAIVIYGIPAHIQQHLDAVVDNRYGNYLAGILAHGPGTIDARSVKGLVGFPSFHAAEAVVVIWYSRHLKMLFPLFAAFNVLTLLATPVQGGHHLIDVLAGGAVAAVAIWVAAFAGNRLAAWDETEQGSRYRMVAERFPRA